MRREQDGFNVIFVAVAVLIVLAGLGVLISSLPTKTFSDITVTGDITVGGEVDGRDIGGTHSERISVSSDEFGRPNTNPPNIVTQDNIQLLSFTIDTDSAFYKFPVPSDYASGDMVFEVIWTNDGGSDDNGLAVKWEIGYQVGDEGDQVSGSHANSPKSSEDTYVGTTGWVEHHTNLITIGVGDFTGEDCVFLKLSAITPVGTELSCEPHLIGMCFIYTAYNVVDS